MGGLLHLFYLNHNDTAKKFLTHNIENGGLEAPRNSLELPVETSQSYPGGHVLLSYQVEQNLCENENYPSEASMKKLIDEEIYKRMTTRQYTPNVVARLMGMDMLTEDATKLAVQPTGKTSKNIQNNLSEKDRLKKSIVTDVSIKTNTYKQKGLQRFNDSTDRDSGRDGFEVGKPSRREHPQEEELQKFKKDFEAWQAARFSECSKVAEDKNTPIMQPCSQDNLNKENKALRATSKDKTTGSLVKFTGYAFKSSSNDQSHQDRHEYELSMSSVEQKERFPSRSKLMNRELKELPLNSDRKQVKSFSPTRIVILKPGPDRNGSNDDSSWTCSSSTFEEKSSMEDFLEEVKERLKWELQGKVPKSTIARGSGTETPFSETPPKQSLQQISKHARKNVGMNLPRSDSTRSYRNGSRCEEQDSPEFINRDTRRFLSDRLRNVLKNETHSNNPASISGYSRSSLLDINNGRFEDTEAMFNDRIRDEPDIQTRSFRYGSDEDCLQPKNMTPQSLIRSLSAPVTGTSFGKLLLEDRRVVTGAHIRRKHEETANVAVAVKKQKKERSSIRQRVFSIKNSFGLGGKLFRKKIESASVLPSLEDNPMEDIMSGPTVMQNIYVRDRRENFTEVPPSPASVCSSLNDEYWRATGCFSPVSTSDVCSVEDDSIPHAFRDISSNLIELRRQLNELESDDNDGIPNTHTPVSEKMCKLEDPTEAYIRDLLVASGLYDGSLSKYDHLSKPICNKVFEEVEESCRDITKDSSEADHVDKKVDRRLLFDLLNESISTILGPPMAASKFRRKIVESSNSPLPRGKKLLSLLQEIISVHLQPSTDKSCYLLDNMIAWDLRSNQWFQSSDDHDDHENHDLGRDLECLILGDLIGEIVKDLKL